MDNTERKRLFYVWCEMRRRCTDTDHKQFKDYGGRGITVCERWLKFANFLADMGPRPDDHLLDRIDNESGYGPTNCRWANRSQSNSNRRNCIMVTIDGEAMTLKEACKRVGLKYRPVHKRIMARGWDVSRALSTPIGKGNSHAVR